MSIERYRTVMLRNVAFGVQIGRYVLHLHHLDSGEHRATMAY